jgi:hypothetical protein
MHWLASVDLRTGGDDLGDRHVEPPGELRTRNVAACQELALVDERVPCPSLEVVAGCVASQPRLRRMPVAYAARLLGDADYRQRSSSVSSGSRTETEGSVYRMLAPPHAIRQGRAHSALLIYGNLPPAWIGLRPWFAERELSALARGESATGRG